MCRVCGKMGETVEQMSQKCQSEKEKFDQGMKMG